jgi:hypothetical protein
MATEIDTTETEALDLTASEEIAAMYVAFLRDGVAPNPEPNLKDIL